MGIAAILDCDGHPPFLCVLPEIDRLRKSW